MARRAWRQPANAPWPSAPIATARWRRFLRRGSIVSPFSPNKPNWLCRITPMCAVRITTTDLERKSDVDGTDTTHPERLAPAGYGHGLRGTAAPGRHG